MDRNKTVLNWSSGKDAALALHVLLHDTRYQVTQLLTTVSAEYNRIFMHGIREQLLDIQAQRIGLPLLKIKLPASPDNTVYNNAMEENLVSLKRAGISTVAFGDIFLDDLRIYREQQLAIVGMPAIFPLWKKDTRELVAMIEDTGIEAMIVCVDNTCLGKELLGRIVNRKLLEELPEKVDPCGENGEFHTFVYNAPYFNSPIKVKLGETIFRSYKQDEHEKGFYFLDVLHDE